MCGKNDKSNLVNLTAREHYIAHLLLWKIYENKEMAYALHLMAKCVSNNSCVRNKYNSSKLYELLKVKIISKMSGENASWYGRKHTEESKRKMSESRIGKYTGKNAANYGKKFSKEHREKISSSIIGDKHPNANTVIYYETNSVRRSNFKKSCKKKLEL